VSVRVFLVEDIENLRLLVQELFASIGEYETVGSASTEAEAKLWLEENLAGWDVAIVDLVLEQGSGIGVLGHAKRKWPAKKVVVFSSYVSPGIRTHCLALGADGVFGKDETGEFVSWLMDSTGGRRPEA
jgi:DNA-binding NarL/FixJ family response regulator